MLKLLANVDLIGRKGESLHIVRGEVSALVRGRVSSGRGSRDGDWESHGHRIEICVRGLENCGGGTRDG